jgi:hypothetical protein
MRIEDPNNGAVYWRRDAEGTLMQAGKEESGLLALGGIGYKPVV